MTHPSDSPCPRQLAEDAEPRFLQRYAAFSTSPLLSQRIHPQEPDDFRTAFERDYTRIVHCRAFRRLRGKTQVFLSPKNDHLCTRLEHSIHVASIARTISKSLRLNNDLVAAIAVGHDLGHAPFGHHGERCLHRIAQRFGLRFHHELQSLRAVDHLDSPYDGHPGLNLTFAVRDGIACHYGEGFKEQRLAPNRSKKPDDLLGMERAALPATLEGCVVRFADKVAYLGRDLEDAIAVDILKEKDIPNDVKQVLGVNNGQIIGSLIGDIFACSKGHRYIGVSDRVHAALKTFYEFSNTRLYKSPVVTQTFAKIGESMTAMFERLHDIVLQAHSRRSLGPLRREQGKWVGVLRAFLRDDIRDWLKEPPEQLVIDFIAGMTDEYYMTCYEEMFRKGKRWPLRAKLAV